MPPVVNVEKGEAESDTVDSSFDSATTHNHDTDIVTVRVDAPRTVTEAAG